MILICKEVNNYTTFFLLGQFHFNIGRTGKSYYTILN